jgi:hypothetical protein
VYIGIKPADFCSISINPGSPLLMTAILIGTFFYGAFFGATEIVSWEWSTCSSPHHRPDRRKAGQRSQKRSALVEAIAQLARALDLIAILPSTPALRRQQIKLQVALITPVTHIKGHAAPETKAAAEQARLLIEQAEALGEAPDDPLLIFSVPYGLSATRLWRSTATL